MGRAIERGETADTREAILEAAEAFLNHGGRLREMTITALMAPIPVSREAFYKHFSSRYELIAALMGRFADDVAPGFNQWLGGGDPARDVRSMFDAASHAYVRRAHVLRAVVDAAPLDPGLERLWHDFLDSFIAPAAARISADQESGAAIGSLDPRLTAASIVHLIERLITQELAGPNPPSRQEVADLLTDTMLGLAYRPHPGAGARRGGRPATR
jgi:AcrR family transcriptional regulator